MNWCGGAASSVNYRHLGGSLSRTEPILDAHPSVQAGDEDDLRRRSRVLDGIVVAEGDSKVGGDIGQVPTAPAVTFRPCPAGNPGAVQPPHPQWPETIATHRPVKGGPVKASVADGGRSLQQAAEFCIQPGEGWAAPDVLRSDAVEPEVEGPGEFLGIHGEGPASCHTAIPDLYDPYLADAVGTFVGGVDVDRVESQVSPHGFPDC